MPSFLYIACSFSKLGRNPSRVLSKGPRRDAFFQDERMRRAAAYKAQRQRVYATGDDFNVSPLEKLAFEQASFVIMMHVRTLHLYKEFVWITKNLKFNIEKFY